MTSSGLIGCGLLCLGLFTMFVDHWTIPGLIRTCMIMHDHACTVIGRVSMYIYVNNLVVQCNKRTLYPAVSSGFLIK